MTEGIAIVGMAAVFPGAHGLTAFHQNLRGGVDAIEVAPPGRLDPMFHDPESGRPDRLYCRRGGFLGASYPFDPAPWGIMPLAAESADPDQLLTLDLAARALEDAGLAPASVAGERTGVVLGRGGYMTPGMVRIEQFVRTTGQLETTLKTLLPGLTEEEWRPIRERFQAAIGFRPDASIGLVPNLAASRVANRLDFNGPAYTVDAACASSLLAVEQACGELERGRCDTMLAGGVHLSNDVLFWTVFTQLGALSRSETIRPFDRRADGLLIGEGGGMVVLKRLADAERDGDRVHAVIRGIGIASDGRATSVMSPRSLGQQLAIERAWRAADADPATVGYVEAHGTATPAGDAVELETLTRVFGPAGDQPRVALGSVKSMIGHTMPAAGIAGLIKAALSVASGEIFPSLHCEEPHERLAGTRFRVPAEAEPWTATSGPRRAGVSAFGFGGINAHAVIEAHAVTPWVPGAAREAEAAPFIAAGASPAEVAERIRTGRPGGDGGCRLVVFDPTPKRLERAARIVERGRAWHGRGDMFFGQGGLAAQGGGVAFLFPGIEADFEPRADRLAQVLGSDPIPPGDDADLRARGLAVVSTGLLMDRAVRRLGIEPDAIAGHSIGEWAGMVASGMVAEEGVDGFVGHMLSATLDFPDVVFAALGCGARDVESRLDDSDEIVVSHDNCPHQSIVCGTEAAVSRLIENLGAAGILCQTLPFRSGFHAPFLESQVRAHGSAIEKVTIGRPAVPLWSATLASRYPEAEEDVRSLATDHLVRPVRFRQLVEALYDDGIRTFIQLGSGSLTAFVEDTLKGKPHLAISACSPRRDATWQVRRVAAALWIEGYAVRRQSIGGDDSASRPLALRLSAPLVEPEGLAPLEGLQARAKGPEIPTAGDTVLEELAATWNLLSAAQEDLGRRWREARSGSARPAPVESRTMVRIDLDNHPELIDHSFFPQPPDWASVGDRFPVVPLTMHLDLMMEAARELVPGREVVAIEQVRALRWLAVEPPAEVAITARFDGEKRVAVTIGENSSGTVVLDDDYPAPPAPREPRPARDGAVPMPAAELYSDRWMFHGPAYQVITESGNMGPDGICGTLRASPARGSLLDGAGQLAGYWIVGHTDRDRLAFPVRVDRIEFFGPAPAAGTEVDCAIWIRDAGEVFVEADLELSVGGRVWARATGWTDRRFETDDVLYELLRYPERNLLAEPHPAGFVIAREHWTSVASRELIARRFLGGDEIARFLSQGPRQQRAWLLGRIAAKDAVRDHVWRNRREPFYPVEIEILNADDGRPLVESRRVNGLHLSLAHKPDIAVAAVSDAGPVGIDVEVIEPREPGFASLAFGDAERERLGSDRDDEVLARAWAAKEAYAKALGSGLGGNPRQFEILAIDGERMQVGGPGPQPPRWILTVREGDHVIAVTDEFPEHTVERP